MGRLKRKRSAKSREVISAHSKCKNVKHVDIARNETSVSTVKPVIKTSLISIDTNLPTCGNDNDIKYSQITEGTSRRNTNNMLYLCQICGKVSESLKQSFEHTNSHLNATLHVGLDKKLEKTEDKAIKCIKPSVTDNNNTNNLISEIPLDGLNSKENLYKNSVPSGESVSTKSHMIQTKENSKQSGCQNKTCTKHLHKNLEKLPGVQTRTTKYILHEQSMKHEVVGGKTTVFNRNSHRRGDNQANGSSSGGNLHSHNLGHSEDDANRTNSSVDPLVILSELASQNEKIGQIIPKETGKSNTENIPSSNGRKESLLSSKVTDIPCIRISESTVSPNYPGSIHSEKKLRSVFYKCGKCSITLNSIEELKTHSTTQCSKPVHIEAVEGSVSEEGVKSQLEAKDLTCDIDLKEQTCINFAHRIVPISDSRYKCSFCDKQFIEYKDSIKQNTSSKPLKAKNSCGNNIFNNDLQKRESPTPKTEDLESFSDFEDNFKQTESTDDYLQDTVLIKNQKEAEEEVLICEFCGKLYKTEFGLAMHRNIHSTYKPFKCSRCPEAFRNETSMMCHMATHTGMRPYKCQQCDKSYMVRKRLLRHIASHTIGKQFKCKICARSFLSLEHVNQHEERHSKVETPKCSICKDVFESVDEMKLHKEKHFNISLNDPNINTMSNSEQPVAENPAGKPMLDSTVVQEQPTIAKKTVAKTRRFKCDMCVRAFRDPKYLRRHRKLHKSNTLFQCQVCNMTYPDNSLLQLHSLKHEGVNLLKCGDCKRIFTTPFSLMGHKKEEKRKATLKCRFCYELFPTMCDLRIHKQFRHGAEKKYFPCEYCSKVLRNEQSRDKHIQQHVERNQGVLPAEVDFNSVDIETFSSNAEQMVNNIVSVETTEAISNLTERSTLYKAEDPFSVIPSVSDTCEVVTETFVQTESAMYLDGYFDHQNLIDSEPDVHFDSIERPIIISSTSKGVNGKKDKSSCNYIATTSTDTSQDVSTVDGASVVNAHSDTDNLCLKDIVCSVSSDLPVIHDDHVYEKTPRKNKPVTLAAAQGGQIMSYLLAAKTDSSTKTYTENKSEQNENDSSIKVEYQKRLRSSSQKESSLCDVLHPVKKKHKCGICQKEFLRRKELSKHLNSHIKLEFNCPDCKQVFTSKVEWMGHQKDSHGIELDSRCLAEEKVVENNNVVKCTYCDENLEQDLLDSHLSIHTKERHYQYQCMLCKNSFVSSSDLVVHGVNEADEWEFLCLPCKDSIDNYAKKRPVKKNHTCSICAKVFISKSYLKDHMSIHADAKPFKCPVKECSKCYASEVLLARHARDHSFRYTCTVCECTFTRCSSLKEHLETIHGEGPPQICDICDKLCQNAIALKRHKFTHKIDPDSNVYIFLSKLTKS